MILEKYIKFDSFKDWNIYQHEKRNHAYGGTEYYELPYAWHLEQCDIMYERFKYLEPDKPWIKVGMQTHDNVEDLGITRNDIKEALEKFNFSDEDIIKICKFNKALTNNVRGENRAERMPDWVYEDIKNTEGATFGKLLDRAANLRHGIITQSSMQKMYKKEHKHFKEMLYVEGQYEDLWAYIESLYDFNL